MIKLQDKTEFLSGIDTLLLDCDGVLWSGSQLIPDIARTLASLRCMGKRIIFVTNNSSKSRLDYTKKFADKGLDASVEEIFSSAYSAAAYIEKLGLLEGKRVYVVGMSGIQDELSLKGIPWVGGEDDNDIVFKETGDLEKIEPDPSIGAVLVGLDIWISYPKLAKAYSYLTANEGCHFLATNDDATFPAGGRFYYN
jgi:4-nitrophenyl phosphatase